MERFIDAAAFLGTIIVAVAYIPQIVHLIRKHCAYGISIGAWGLWLFAALLLLPHAIILKAPIFIVLFSIQIIAILFILIFSYFHQDKFCGKHKIL